MVLFRGDLLVFGRVFLKNVSNPQGSDRDPKKNGSLSSATVYYKGVSNQK